MKPIIIQERRREIGEEHQEEEEITEGRKRRSSSSFYSPSSLQEGGKEEQEKSESPVSMPRSHTIDSIVDSVFILPRQHRARRLRHLLRHHVRRSVNLHRGRRSHHAMRAERRVPRLGVRRVMPVPQPMDDCLAPGRVQVFSPNYCQVHGWTAIVRMENAESPQIIQAFHQEYGWATFIRDVAGPSAPPSPTSPEPRPSAPSTMGGEASNMPPRGTIAARRGMR